MEQKEIILFGCGHLGYEALYFLGEENVKCFCDNNPEVVRGDENGEIEVISFEKLKSRYKDNIVIVCALNPDVVYAIARQCEENEVYDYVSFEMLRRMGQDRKTCLDYLYDSAIREKLRKELWKSKIQRLEKQVDYFKRHADIRHLKPAEGRLREWQLQCVHAAVEVMKKIEKLDIHPFLLGANLIGYVRHNGFVPWDDDIDFGIIRGEYERLKNYCKENLYTVEEYEEKERTGKAGRSVADGMEDFCWACYPGNLVIFYRLISVDFFVYDYYDENILFEDMLDYAVQLRNIVKTLHSTEEKIQYLEEVKSENKLQTVGKSSRIYFGVDNVEMEHKYHKGYIPEDVIFPLKKAVWEGKCFSIPNNPEEYLKYEFDNIWKFPEDIGIPKHYAALRIDENK